MWLYVTYVPVVIYQSNNICMPCLSFVGIRFYDGTDYLFTIQTPLHLNKKPKYYIYVCPKSDYYMLYLGQFILSYLIFVTDYSSDK